MTNHLSANTYKPLQAPEDAIDKHKYIKDMNRYMIVKVLHLFRKAKLPVEKTLLKIFTFIDSHLYVDL